MSKVQWTSNSALSTKNKIFTRTPVLINSSKSCKKPLFSWKTAVLVGVQRLELWTSCSQTESLNFLWNEAVFFLVFPVFFIFNDSFCWRLFCFFLWLWSKMRSVAQSELSSGLKELYKLIDGKFLKTMRLFMPVAPSTWRTKGGIYQKLSRLEIFSTGHFFGYGSIFSSSSTKTSS